MSSVMKSWSDCLKLYDSWQKGEIGITNRIQNVDKVDFDDFSRSFNSIIPSEQKTQVQAVNTVLKIRQHLERVFFGYLFGCDLNDDHLKVLLEVFANVKVDELHVSQNPNIGPSGMIHLAKLAEQCEVKKLSAWDCNLESEHLKNFVENAGNAKVDELHVSKNPNIGPSGMIHLAKLAEQCEVKKLTAWSCNLESEHLKNFVENAGNAKIDELNVSDNNIGPSGMIHLAKLAEQCEVKKLSAEDCNLESEHLKNFVENAGNAKLTELNIGWNSWIGSEGWLHIGQFIKRSGLRRLTATDCQPLEEDLEEFIHGMNGAKVDYLDLNLEEYGYEEDQPSNILSLLPLVNEKLYLYGWDISDDQRKEIQEKLNQDRLMSLTVVIGSWWRRMRLRAPPMNLPSTLDSVENVKANQDGDSILVKWDPLDANDVRYHVHVESECKTVDYDITTADTSCRMLSLRSKTVYRFYVWGFTSTAISEYTSFGRHITGIIHTSQPESVIANVDNTRNTADSRKRSNPAMNTGVGNEESCKPKKARVLESWLETGSQAIGSTPPADNDQYNANMTVNGQENPPSLNSTKFRMRNTEATGALNVGMTSNGVQVMPQRIPFTRLQEDFPDLFSLSPAPSPDDQSTNNMADQSHNVVQDLMNAGLKCTAYPDTQDIWNVNGGGGFSGDAGWDQASVHNGQQFRGPSNHEHGASSSGMMNDHPANGNFPTTSVLDADSATLPAAAQRLQHVDALSDSQPNDQFTAHRDSQTPMLDILAAAMPSSLNEFPMDSSPASNHVYATLRTVHASTNHMENVRPRNGHTGNHMANNIPSQRSHPGDQRPVNLSTNHTGSIPPLNAHAVDAVLQMCYMNPRQGNSSANDTGRLLQPNSHAGNPAVGSVSSQISHSADERRMNSSAIHTPPLNVQATNPTANAIPSASNSSDLRAADSPANYMGNVGPSDIQAGNPTVSIIPSQMRYSTDQRQVNSSMSHDGSIVPPKAHGGNSATNTIPSQINYSSDQRASTSGTNYSASIPQPSAHAGNPASSVISSQMSCSAGQRSSNPPTWESNLANICREMSILRERVAKQEDKIAKLEDDRKTQKDEIAKQEDKIAKLEDDRKTQRKEIAKLKDEKKKLKKSLDGKINRNKKSQSNEIAKIKEENQTQGEEIANLKNRVERMTRTDQPAHPDQMQEFTLPLTTVDKVNENDALLADKERAKKLISYLGTLGGSKSKDIVHRIMRKLFVNNVAKAYSWEGKKGKLSFCQLKILNVIREACKKYRITEAKADKYAMLWLRGAPGRDGGRKRRELQKQEKASQSADSEAQKEKASHSADTEESTS